MAEHPAPLWAERIVLAGDFPWGRCPDREISIRHHHLSDHCAIHTNWRRFNV